MNIMDFLLARIAEDEDAAQAATAGPWTWDDDEASFLRSGDESVISAYGMHTEGYVDATPADREHIARHDPARVLVECKAKRAIISDVAGLVEAIDLLTDALPGDSQQDADAPFRTSVLRHLASSHKDHPDYKQEWSNV